MPRLSSGARVWICLSALLQVCVCEEASEEASPSVPSERRLLTARRLDSCPNTQSSSGWRCSTNTQSVYCDCHRKKSMLSKKSKWSCKSSNSETCTVGSPACFGGRCKDDSQACGTTWAGSLAQTCEQLFTTDTYAKTNCTNVFGTNQAVCPQSVLGAGYLSWANRMKNTDQVKGMLQASAMDTVWWWAKFADMVNETDGKTVPASLLTTDIMKHKAVLQKFACLRNVPQCQSDRPATATCISSCLEVNQAVDTWSNDCKAALSAAECEGLGYTRDCDGTNAAAAGAYPGLCTAFQQQLNTQTSAATAAMISSSILLSLFLMFAHHVQA